MIRSVIVALLCLLAVVPPGVCVCAHGHADLADHPDCPDHAPVVTAVCHCHDAAPDPAPPDRSGSPDQAVAVAHLPAVDPVVTHLSRPVVSIPPDPPPPVPLFLSTSRLRN